LNYALLTNFYIMIHYQLLEINTSFISPHTPWIIQKWLFETFLEAQKYMEKLFQYDLDHYTDKVSHTYDMKTSKIIFYNTSTWEDMQRTVFIVNEIEFEYWESHEISLI